MQQSQIIGISILFGGCGGKIVYTDIKKDEGSRPIHGGRHFSDVEACFVTMAGVEGEASILNKLQDHPNHVLIRKNS